MKMTAVVFQPSMASAEVIAIVKSDTQVDGDIFQFVSEWEAAHFCRVFMKSHSPFLVGEWTQRVMSMSDVDMNDLLSGRD